MKTAKIFGRTMNLCPQQKLADFQMVDMITPKPKGQIK